MLQAIWFFYFAYASQKKTVPKELEDEFNLAEEALVYEKFLASYNFGNVPAKTDNQRLQMDKVCISAMLELRASSKYNLSLFFIVIIFNL
jgi:hypothetical protein